MADVRVSIDLAGVEKKVSPQAMQRGKIAAGSEALLIMDSSVPVSYTHLFQAQKNLTRPTLHL